MFRVNVSLQYIPFFMPQSWTTGTLVHRSASTETAGQMQTDDELVQAVLSGRKDDFAPLVQRHQASVLAAGLNILGDIEAARDVSQDAFIHAYQRLPKLTNGGAFGAWVTRIARNLALDKLRRRRKITTQPLPADTGGIPALVAPAGCDRLELAQEHSALLKAVMKLPEHERTVLMMRYFDDMALRDIALATYRPIGTISKRISRGLQRLGNMLGGSV
jgi:RNA polymerase sigma-70 factor (ECF subfamily)